jgi:hypothetical protein
MDGVYYFDDTANILASQYTPLLTHNADVTQIDSRLDLLEASDSTQGSILAAQAVSLSNIINKPGNKDDFPWTDVFGPVLTGGADILGDLLQHWLGNQSFKDFLKDFLAKQIGTGVPDVDINDDDILDMPEVPVDFRRLASNCFVVDRSATQSNVQNFGVTVDRDFNMLSGKKFNLLDPGVLMPSAFGAAYNPMVMSAGAKFPIMDFTGNNIDLQFKTGTFKQRVTTSNFEASNMTVSDFYANKISGTDVAAYTVTGVTVNASTFGSSNLTIYGKDDFVDGVVNKNATIKNDGTASFQALSINKNNFEVKSDGSVHINGLMVITSSGKVLVHDDEIISSGHRYKMDDVLSGNIGSTDTYAFSKDVALWDTAEVATPLNMANTANEDEMLKILMGEMSESITESLNSTLDRVSSVTGVSDFKRVYSLDDDEDDFWEIDLVTGKVKNAPALVEAPALELTRTDSFSDIFSAPLVNAPLHSPEATTIKTFIGQNDPLSFDTYDTAAFPQTNYAFEDDAFPVTATVLDEKTDNMMKIFESYFDNRRRMTTYLGIDGGDLINLPDLPDPPNTVPENGFSFDTLPLKFPTTIFSGGNFTFDTRPESQLNPFYFPSLLRFDSSAF